MQSHKELLEAVGQQHLLKFYDDLDRAQQLSLAKDISDVDWRALDTIYKEQVVDQLDGDKLKPVTKLDESQVSELPDDHVGGTARSSQEELDRFRSIGLSSISQGKVAALLLAGGQGTRLGVDYPKGMFAIGPPIGKCLFQLQAERLIEVNNRAKTLSTGETKPIIWYIMTSEATMERTREFFKGNNYFGLEPDNIVFFEQDTIPSFDFKGKVLLSDKNRISRSPNGNGGLYEALHKRNIIDHMRANHVEYVHVYCVDNVLVRVCDPTFIGFCIEKQVDAGAKVVEKKLPNESVGTICKVGGQFKVIEYSEIPDMIANKRDPKTGKLSFSSGNICEHFFKVDFLSTICGDKNLRYHLAIKKIPFVSLETGEIVKPTVPNGIKLEKFVFDVFELTEKFVVWEVERDDEFSPLKNADGTEKDNPTTARKALLRAYELGLLKA
jgi:UDP-N-acetylglucosamine/UDP-N-acetylgalactosamine diphosphorylase